MIKICKQYIQVFLLILKVSVVLSIEQPDFSELADILRDFLPSTRYPKTTCRFFGASGGKNAAAMKFCNECRNGVAPDQDAVMLLLEKFRFK